MTDSEPMEPAAPDAPSNNGKFQPGRSGNPKGRPRKANTVGASVRDALAAKVTINEGGKRRRITLADATAKQWANKGASGDLRAGKLAFDMAAKGTDRLKPQFALRTKYTALGAVVEFSVKLILLTFSVSSSGDFAPKTDFQT